MRESLIATAAFWSAFAFSIGPFWIAVMEAARTTSLGVLFRNYLVYCLTGWGPILAVIGLIVGTIGALSEQVYTALYFVGAVVIFHLAYKTLSARAGQGGGLDFNWRVMTVVSWTNPKVWTTIPAGFLAANYTGSLALNIVLFILVSLPLFWIALCMWYVLGRQGARLVGHRLGAVNAALLAGFGIYLLVQGVGQATGG